MYSCSTCFRRAISNVIQDFPSHHVNLPIVVASSRVPWTQIAQHSTVESIQQPHHLRILRKALRKPKKIKQRPRNQKYGITQVDRKNQIAREQNARHREKEPAVPAVEGDQPMSLNVRRRKQAEFEMRFFKDPLQLANAVLAKLKRDDVEGALALVRASEKTDTDNLVSWNHIIDYHLHIRDVKGALKDFNDMKKRGHRPDAYTYTILLRGLKDNLGRKNEDTTAHHALSIYNSMFQPSSLVTPNIIHTNAVINVCARAGKMDSVWGILGRLPENGPGAPDKWTFTIVLNALAANAVSRVPALIGEHDEMDLSVTTKILDEAAQDGRKLWEDINPRWRAGVLDLDESLVCAMGRLLMISTRSQHWSEVFALVEQTMNIPQISTHLKPFREIEAPKLKQPAEEKLPQNNLVVSDLTTGEPQNESRFLSKNYVIPGSNSLSMLLETAVKLKDIKAGKRYWELLTDLTGPFKVEPDLVCYATYLRLLRISRSSKVVVEVLRQLTHSKSRKASLKRGNFIIAMSTCVRDKDNPNVLDHATSILDMMSELLNEPDAQVMEMYLSLALVTTPGISHLLPGPFVPDPQKNSAMRAVAQLSPHIASLKNNVKDHVEAADTAKLRPFRSRNAREMARHSDEDAFAAVENQTSFLQAMVGAYDRLLKKADQLPKHIVVDYTTQKSTLGYFLTKVLGQRLKPHRKEPSSAQPEDVVDLAAEEEDAREMKWRIPRFPIQSAKRELDRKRAQFPPRGGREEREKNKSEKGGFSKNRMDLNGWGSEFAEMERTNGKGFGMAM